MAQIPPTVFEQPSVQRAAGEGAQSVAVVDIDRDGYRDAVVANSLSDDISVLFGGPGGILERDSLVVPWPGPSAVRVADMDRDRRLDIVLAATGDEASQVVVLRQLPAQEAARPQFEAVRAVDVGDGPQEIAVADFNGDRILDVVTANSESFPGSVSFLRGRGDGRFVLAVDTFVGESFSPRGMAAADFDRDGAMDVVVTNAGGENALILFGPPGTDGSFRLGQDLTVGTAPLSVAVGDFNIDGRADLVISNEDDDSVAVFLGRGDGTFDQDGVTVDLGAGAGPQGLAIWDFNLDGRPDIAVANTFLGGGPAEAAEGVTILRGNGDGSFQPLAEADEFIVGGLTPVAIATGDLDGDRIRDIVTANVDSDVPAAVSVLLNGGTVLAGDANGDGGVGVDDLAGAVKEAFDLGGASVITVAGGGVTSGPGVDANGDERVGAADLVATIATIAVRS